MVLFRFFALVHLVTSGNEMANLRECHAYKPWHQHASPHSDAYPLGYEGTQPCTPAVLEVNKYNDERQAQLRNI